MSFNTFWYFRQLKNKSLTAGTGFELKSLPMTSDAAKYHSYRTYLTVQQMLGNNNIKPTDWGWTRPSPTEKLVPVVKDNEAAPAKVLCIISCGYKQGCKRNCKCRKSGLLCTSLCSGCFGTECTICDNTDSDVKSYIYIK